MATALLFGIPGTGSKQVGSPAACCWWVTASSKPNYLVKNESREALQPLVRVDHTELLSRCVWPSVVPVVHVDVLRTTEGAGSPPLALATSDMFACVQMCVSRVALVSHSCLPPS